jgi:beta-glucosidase
VHVYNLLKSMPGGDKVQIGIVHNQLTFEPFSKNNVIEPIPCYYLNYIFNDVIFDFLKTGKYEFRMGLNVVKETGSMQAAPKSFDFIGLNYYSRVVAQNLSRWDKFVDTTCRPGEIMTDMPYPIYAEGLYHAIAKMAELKVPIYITENGIADVKDDRRELWIRRYLYALSQAIKDGYDVRGYYYWTLTDNFEWDEGFHPKFGLYEVDFATQERHLRAGAHAYKEIIRTCVRPQ